MKNSTYNRNKKTMIDGSVYNFLRRYNDRTLANYEIKIGIDGMVYNCNLNNGFCYNAKILQK